MWRAMTRSSFSYSVSGLLSRSVHLLEDLLGESLLNLVDVAVTASGPDTSSLGLSELLDVSIHGVLSMLMSA